RRVSVGPLGVLLIVVLTATVTAFVLLSAAEPRTSPRPSRTAAASGRAQAPGATQSPSGPAQSGSGHAQPRPSRSQPSAGPSRRPGSHQRPHPTSAPADLPWRPASTLPKGLAVFGPDAQIPAALAKITSGECLAWAQSGYVDLVDLVDCSGPHTDEVTSV